MPRFKGKAGDFYIFTGQQPVVVESAPGGLSCVITLMLVGASMKFEVEGTLDTIIKLLADEAHEARSAPPRIV